MNAIPKKTHVLVVGGGPAGSTAAGLLARDGLDVTLLEQAQFPRYHVGESLLPTILPILDLLGAREKFEAHGFQRKYGAYLEWGNETMALDFGELSGNYTHAFQVRREEFDLMMLEHAGELGAKVFQNMEVRSFEMDGDRPVRANWHQKAVNGSQPELGEISFDYLIDASGRNGLMANRYLKNRKYHNAFQNVGLWGYWKNTDRLATGREGDIAVSSISRGWLWGIPLSDGTMSIGAVMHKDLFNQFKNNEVEAIYSESIDASPLMRKIIKNAQLISPITAASDYSYASEKFCGPGYFMVGDAACFLDPLLSNGVHLATMSAMLASACIVSLTHGDVEVAEAQLFFENSYRQAYLRFLVFLSAFYDVGRSKETYFWEAQRVTQQDVSADSLKVAFLNLVTGVKDLADIQSNETHHFVLQEMSKRIDDNLRLRKDKKTLAGMKGKKVASARDNAHFFDSIEGLFAINEAEAIGGLYVTLAPKFGLARVRSVQTSLHSL